MSFFEYMDNIYLEDYEQFLKEIDSKRSELYRVDSALIQQKPEKVADLNEFQLRTGRFDVKIGGEELECFFYLKKAPTLYVLFSGSLTKEAPPEFNRWSYYPWLNGSVLSISDPMYNRFEDLKLGWYYGTEQESFRIKIVELVEKVAGKLNLSNKEIVFFSSSGGASAAIECAALLPGAIGMVINPQLVLKEWPWVSDFEKITGIDLSEDKKWHRNNVIWHVKNCTNSRYIILINIRNAVDMQQAINLCKQLNITLKYGMNIFEHYIIWLYDAEGGASIASHNMQEFRELIFVLEYIKDNFDCITGTEFGGVSRLINEFWRAHWEQRKQISANRSLNISKYGKKVVVFGTGSFLERLSKERFYIASYNYYGISLAIDNNKMKAGQLWEGTIPIVHVSEVTDWEELFVIITTDAYYKEITEQLENLGLLYGINFVLWRDL